MVNVKDFDFNEEAEDMLQSIFDRQSELLRKYIEIEI
jgi:hypothetical protein